MAWLTYIVAAALVSVGVHGVEKSVIFNERSWRRMLQGEWMVKFYAPWCPACKSLMPVWEEFAIWGPHIDIKVGQVDITQNPGLSGRFMVTALPTIYHVKDGVFRQYSGARDKDSLMSFIDNKRWKEVKPISDWKHPDSLQMSTVAQFFRWSYQIRAIHNYLIDNYGFPYWASYASFALLTIVVGALLGLLIVWLIDLIFPPKTIEDHTIYDATARAADSDFAEEESTDPSTEPEKESKESAAKKKRSKKDN